jgi:kexin
VRKRRCNASKADRVDGYGKLDGGLFVEAAEKWNLVKPQAWYDAPAVHLPDDSDNGRRLLDAPAISRDDSEDHASTDSETPANEGHNESEGEGQPDPIPVQKPHGAMITSDGIKSTYEVTQDMLDDANLETLEHVTVRVWIDHQRRGDVEVVLQSPNGINSALARFRRYDEDSTGFQGWKFMSIKHW